MYVEGILAALEKMLRAGFYGGRGIYQLVSSGGGGNKKRKKGKTSKCKTKRVKWKVKEKCEVIYRPTTFRPKAG